MLWPKHGPFVFGALGHCRTPVKRVLPDEADSLAGRSPPSLGPGPGPQSREHLLTSRRAYCSKGRGSTARVGSPAAAGGRVQLRVRRGHCVDSPGSPGWPWLQMDLNAGRRAQMIQPLFVLLNSTSFCVDLMLRIAGCFQTLQADKPSAWPTQQKPMPLPQ